MTHLLQQPVVTQEDRDLVCALAENIKNQGSRFEREQLVARHRIAALSRPRQETGEVRASDFRKGFREARYFFDPSVDIREATPEEDDAVRMFQAALSQPLADHGMEREGDASVLIEALGAAAFTFETYEKLHSAKGTPDGYEKARKNAEMAARCRTAIDAYRSSTAPDELRAERDVAEQAFDGRERIDREALDRYRTMGWGHDPAPINLTTMQRLIGTIDYLAALARPDRMAEMKRALDDLQQAEAEYRLMHDRHGDGSRAAGRAWDLMRRAGDKARAAISRSEGGR